MQPLYNALLSRIDWIMSLVFSWGLFNTVNRYSAVCSTPRIYSRYKIYVNKLTRKIATLHSFTALEGTFLKEFICLAFLHGGQGSWLTFSWGSQGFQLFAQPQKMLSEWLKSTVSSGTVCETHCARPKMVLLWSLRLGKAIFNV